MGDWVYLKLQPYRQTSIALRKTLKLPARYYGPFQIIAKVDQVACKLELPLTTTIHPVFHVSLLKKKVGENVTPILELPSFQEDQTVIVAPEKL